MNNDLVSIIIPVYNASNFILETINTVVNQTYTNWELLLVDDISTDNSVEIINNYIKNNKEKNIKLLKLKEKGLAAGARNYGIDKAKGRYICYLDADDLWDKNKLSKQVKFMKEKDCAFSFTGYEFANSKGIPNGKKVYIPEKMAYKDALKNTTIWTTTVMLDMNKLSKEDIYMPHVKSEDTASWWSILKKVDYAYGLNEILSFYRRTEGTLSSNKLEAIKRIWNLYRTVEHLNIFKSSYYFCNYAINAVLRRV